MGDSNDRNRADDERKQKFSIDDFDFIRFTVADMHGIPRGRLIPSCHAKGFIDTGMGIYSGTVGSCTHLEMDVMPERVLQEGAGNVQAVAIMDTLYPVTWVKGSHRVAEVLCETQWELDNPQEACPRFAARKQVQALEAMGYDLYSAFEVEFHMFHRKNSRPLFQTTDIYSTLILAEHEALMMDMASHMRNAGIDVESLHAEHSPGQFEITVKPKYGLEAADTMFKYKGAVKEIALQHDMTATFMAKPSREVGASGMHFNHSLWDSNGLCIFDDPANSDHFSELGMFWVGGLMKHATALSAFYCPTVNDYRRIGTEDSVITGDITWSINSKLAALSAKSTTSRSGKKSWYFEYRLPSSSANPYLVLAATIAAGMDGIKNRIQPPPALQGLQFVDGKFKYEHEYEKLPLTLGGALDALQRDGPLVEAIGTELVDWFVAVKRFEIASVENAGSEEKAFDVELHMYQQLL